MFETFHCAACSPYCYLLPTRPYPPGSIHFAPWSISFSLPPSSSSCRLELSRDAAGAAPAFPVTLPSIPRASAISYPSSTFPKLWSRYSPAKPPGIKGARPATMDAPLQASARASPWPDSGRGKHPHTLLYHPQLAPFHFPRRNRAPHELPRWHQWLFGADPVPPLLPCLESPKKNPLTLLSLPMPLASRTEAGSAIPMELSELVLTVMAARDPMQQ